MTTLISSQPSTNSDNPFSNPPIPSSRSPARKAPPSLPLKSTPTQPSKSVEEEQQGSEEEELDDEDLEILGMQRGGRRHKAGIPGNSFTQEPKTPTSMRSIASVRSNKSQAREPTMKDGGTSDVSSILFGLIKDWISKRSRWEVD